MGSFNHPPARRTLAPPGKAGCASGSVRAGAELQPGHSFRVTSCSLYPSHWPVCGSSVGGLSLSLSQHNSGGRALVKKPGQEAPIWVSLAALPASCCPGLCCGRLPLSPVWGGWRPNFPAASQAPLKHPLGTPVPVPSTHCPVKE